MTTFNTTTSTAIAAQVAHESEGMDVIIAREEDGGGENGHESSKDRKMLFSASASLPSSNSTATVQSNKFPMSIPELLSLSPGFGSRQPQRSIPVPINRQLASLHSGSGQAGASPQSSSFNWAPLSARSALKPPVSAMGIGFGEQERTKHVRISVAPDFMPSLSARYVPPARRSLVDGGKGIRQRRASLNDSNPRRALAELGGQPKAKNTPATVKFPESTVIESGKIPSWEERRRIRLARGTAIATVRTTIVSPSTPNSVAISPGLTRSLVVIAREDRKENSTDGLGPHSENIEAPLTSQSLAGETPVARTDMTSSLSGKTSGDGGKQVPEIEESTPSRVEIVEVFRMSGGGRGAGSEWAKAKFRTVSCRDFAAGYCSYGNFCSFIHEAPQEGSKGAGEDGATKEMQKPKETVASTDILEDGATKEMQKPKETVASTDILAASTTIEAEETLIDSDPSTLVKLQVNGSDGESSSLESVETAETPSSQAHLPRKSESLGAKSDTEFETRTPSLLQGSSAVTIKALDTNPAIVVQDLPLTAPGVSGSPSTILKPAKFRSGNIVVPDYRWTKEQGMVPSPTSPSLDFSNMRAKSKMLQGSGIANSLLAPASLASGVDRVFARTINLPVQYANAPPLQTWLKPKGTLTNLCPEKGMTQSSATASEAPEESPFLPITAYSFSTDSSSPPATPSDQRQEVITPESEEVALPAVCMYSDSASHNPYDRLDGNTWTYQTTGDQYLSDSTPVYRDAMAPAPLEAWMVDAYLLQMSQQPENEMWFNPFSSGYGIPKSKFMLAKQLAKQVRAGALPPQLPQSRTNYRTKPCRFYLEGNCPHGEGCSYSHDQKVIAKAKRRTDSIAHKLRTQPCKFYNSAEGCHWGEECPFLHQYILPIGAPLMPKPRPWRTKPCRHYAEGRCLAGEQCHFAHIGVVPSLKKVQRGTFQSSNESEDGHEQAAKRERTRKTKKKSSQVHDLQIITSA
ncbi:hypothetical protein NliqN6_4270 [Naganishia liquefaciens]|uniref:C3H1-type domain-containing protein n=1 Tax=Naganishia liquefaciens TaxID=104408 RepID=A0A8H3TVI9_9TREE|nr:hypothetical protein NliqN6_4270 [Naganishia liquefaciens]